MFALLFGCSGVEPGCPEEPGTICAVAGTGQLGFNGDDLPAEETWLYFPSALREAPDGRLAIVDYNNMRVRAVQEDGTLTTLAGNGRHEWSTPGALPLESAIENPIDAAWGADGTFYILPQHESRVLMVAADGTLVPCIGRGEPGYDGDGGDPLAAAISEGGGLAVDGAAIYVADTLNNVIRVVRDGVIETLAGALEAGFVDGVGAEARFSGPQRIAVADGVLYVADANNHAIRAIDVASGRVTTLVGTGERGYSGDGGPPRAAALAYPQGVSVSDGAVWIADSGNNVVRVVRDDEITTFAGTGTEGYSGDGHAAVDAELAFPAAVLVRAESVYIADMQNGAVRVVHGVR